MNQRRDVNLLRLARGSSDWTTVNYKLYISDLKLPDTTGVKGLHLFQADDSTLYLLGGYSDSTFEVPQSDSGILYKTTNFGQLWEKCRTVPGGYNNGVAHFSESDVGIFIHSASYKTGNTVGRGVGTNYIYTTIDGGQTLKRAPVNAGIGFFGSCHSYNRSWFKAFKGRGGEILTTYDNWNTYDSTQPIADLDAQNNYQFIQCTFSGDTIIAGGIYSADGKFRDSRIGVLVRSTDGGKSWGSIQHFPQFISCSPTQPPNRDTIFATGSHLTLPLYLWSTDNGVSWIVDTLIVDGKIPQKDISLSVSADGIPYAICNVNTNGDPGQIIARGSFQKRSVQSASANRIMFYPNPVSNVLHLLDGSTNASIELVDIFGRTVLSMWMLDGTADIDVTILPKGVYYLKCAGMVHKIVLSHE